jgi:electron-transferring-flavoprotein dehydrogenase
VKEAVDNSRTTILVVGAGPAGLACAIRLKSLNKDLDVCVVDKAADLGNHNLSGAVLEEESLHRLLDGAFDDWRGSDEAKAVLSRRVESDNVMFLLGRKLAFNIFCTIRLARLMRLGFGQLVHKGDYIVSISELTGLLGRLARRIGVEVFFGFAADDIVFENGRAAAVKLVDQGLDKDRRPQPNFLRSELVRASIIVLAEGCDGLVTEKFVKKAGLERRSPQLYSLGVKELIKVNSRQYRLFGDGRVVHAMGYPIWTPLRGPAMFGGGIMYPVGEPHIAVGMIVGLDWKYCDFNPQDALTNFKNARFVRRFIEGGTVVEAGAKMIPEGGYYAVPRDPRTGSIGRANVLVVGDGAGFVNMLKIKGLHNAIDSGAMAAEAAVASLAEPQEAAAAYTRLVDCSSLGREMKSAGKFRQTVARLGPTVGFGLSVFGGLLPRFRVHEDYLAARRARYRLKPGHKFDKDTFTAVAATEHREEQPCHLEIVDPCVCADKCADRFGRPCITFCPAGVYETVGGVLKPANPSNCLHCKTCQRKCPFDNIRWTVPEGGGGPRYKRM